MSNDTRLIRTLINIKKFCKNNSFELMSGIISSKLRPGVAGDASKDEIESTRIYNSKYNRCDIPCQFSIRSEDGFNVCGIRLLAQVLAYNYPCDWNIEKAADLIYDVDMEVK